jgi:acyl-CoA thioesterase I
MPPAAMHFASGNSFFSGLLLIAAAHLIVPGGCARHPRFHRGVAFILLIVGGLFVILSSTPLSWWIHVGLAASILPLCRSLLRMGGGPNSPRRSRPWPSFAGFTAIAAAAAICEWNATRFRPQPGFENDLPIYVIGDSISAASTDTAITTWPDLLRQNGQPVTNLARIGATAHSAIQQAQRIPPGPAVVHVLIGGNDFFGSTSAVQFETDFAGLLKQLAAPDRAIVVWELPLPPFHHAFGAAQRRQIAAVQGAIISKRILSRVLSTPGATVDGIHLSQLGQRAMAASALEFLPPGSGR